MLILGNLETSKKKIKEEIIIHSPTAQRKPVNILVYFLPVFFLITFFKKIIKVTSQHRRKIWKMQKRQ